MDHSSGNTRQTRPQQQPPRFTLNKLHFQYNTPFVYTELCYEEELYYEEDHFYPEEYSKFQGNYTEDKNVLYQP